MKKKKPFADEETREKLKQAFKKMKDRGDTPFKDMDDKQSENDENDTSD